MTYHIWRRCPDCGQLSLVPYGVDTVCDCRTRPSEGERPSALGAPGEAGPGLEGRVDAVAFRLLQTVFPDGVDL